MQYTSIIQDGLLLGPLFSGAAAPLSLCQAPSAKKAKRGGATRIDGSDMEAKRGGATLRDDSDTHSMSSNEMHQVHFLYSLHIVSLYF
jgi:hypothetical protein